MDYVTIYLDDGTREQMEVVTIYEMSNSEYHYIIYRSSSNEYFIAKYLGEEVTDLNTNLDRNEMLYGQGILDGLVGR